MRAPWDWARVKVPEIVRGDSAHRPSHLVIRAAAMNPCPEFRDDDRRASAAETSLHAHAKVEGWGGYFTHASRITDCPPASGAAVHAISAPASVGTTTG